MGDKYAKNECMEEEYQEEENETLAIMEMTRRYFLRLDKQLIKISNSSKELYKKLQNKETLLEEANARNMSLMREAKIIIHKMCEVDKDEIAGFIMDRVKGHLNWTELGAFEEFCKDIVNPDLWEKYGKRADS
jgi:hypothetical protein